jgi:hypothetical protein
LAKALGKRGGWRKRKKRAGHAKSHADKPARKSSSAIAAALARITPVLRNAHLFAHGGGDSRDGELARFGPDAALPDVLMALAPTGPQA